MKKVLFIFFLLTVIIPIVNAQDVITLKKGNDIRAKVTEIGTDEVKYKQFNNPSGPVYTIRKSEIFRIKYENGDVDIFESEPGETGAPVRTTPSGVRLPKSQATQQRQPVKTQQSRTQQSKIRQQERFVEDSEESVYDENLWPNRKGYMGISVGPAFLSDDKNMFGTGIQVAFNFSYLLSPHVGISSSIFVTDFPVSVSGITLDDYTIGLFGVVAGPVFSTLASESGKVELDFRPAIGFARGVLAMDEDVTTSEISFVFSAGASLRINLSSRFSLSIHADYFNSKAEGVDLSSFGISGGANYRF